MTRVGGNSYHLIIYWDRSAKVCLINRLKYPILDEYLIIMYIELFKIITIKYARGK